MIRGPPKAVPSEEIRNPKHEIQVRGALKKKGRFRNRPHNLMACHILNNLES